MSNIRNNNTLTILDIHVCCIAHVVNLAVKDYLSNVHDYINQIRSLLSAMRYSVKRRDAYE